MLCDTAAGAFARSRWSDGRFTGVVDYRARMCAGGGERGRWWVGDRGREGNDRVIEGGGKENGDQLQTTERPSCVLDYISMDDSVTIFIVSRNVWSLGEYSLMLESLSSRGHPSSKARASLLLAPWFRCRSSPVKNLWHRNAWMLLSNASSIHFISHSRYTHRWRRHFTSLDIAVDHCAFRFMRPLVLDRIHLFPARSY